jgi:hypothetical protein
MQVGNRPTSAQYRDLIERHLSSLVDRPLAEITGDVVEREHRRIAEETRGRHAAETGRATANLG